ncbi:hypothetical protein QFC20_007784 [Naganishia adeliensis]|uniref:Uncharacterized protein n=1 Tax=Naganishia adeliensis TaxID=92952 RepID=A0ACC2UWC0_9TREE|nr:hypothetical protein QFC20_007784 [Naganishia adeliensis]
MASSNTALRKVAVILGREVLSFQRNPHPSLILVLLRSEKHSPQLTTSPSSPVPPPHSIRPSPPSPSSAVAHPFPNTDAADESSIKKAFAEIKEKWPGMDIDVAVFNPGGSFAPGPFLEKSVDDLRKNLEGGVLGAFVFSQCFLRNVPSSGGTLLFTGATMGIRGGAKFGTMAPSKFALRALSQSLAREFGPKGVHVAHVIIDGLIDTERVKGMAGEAEPGLRLDPEAIGKDPSAWTQELDLRPSKETF